MVLSFQFKDNNSLHEDIVLYVGKQSWTCDSYYFALDRQLLPDQEDADKVRIVLKRLLEQWLKAVEQIPDGGIVYLPYDFSDQYIGWLQCKRFGDQIDILRGWSRVGGWSVPPSSVGEYMNEVSGFMPTDPVVQVPWADLIDAIEGLID